MKKQNFIIGIFLLSALLVKSQNNASTFVFDTYIDQINIKDVKDVSSHELGDSIACKLHIIENTFLIRYQTKVGLSNLELEVQKPDLLESVEKLNKYYRKAVKKGNILQNEASRMLSRYMDIAYTLFYEESTEFEKALSKAKTPEQIIALYNRVQLMDKNQPLTNKL